jgi:hypothetical protein
MTALRTGPFPGKENYAKRAIFGQPSLSLIPLVTSNDGFITFLSVPVSISASGVARLGFQLIRIHSRSTD